MEAGDVVSGTDPAGAGVPRAGASVSVVGGASGADSGAAVADAAGSSVATLGDVGAVAGASVVAAAGADVSAAGVVSAGTGAGAAVAAGNEVIRRWRSFFQRSHEEENKPLQLHSWFISDTADNPSRMNEQETNHATKKKAPAGTIEMLPSAATTTTTTPRGRSKAFPPVVGDQNKAGLNDWYTKKINLFSFC